VTNPDRTHRNPNLLIWQRRPWLIDHGAALYIHHDWAGATDVRVRGPFPLIARHVLLARSDGLEAADEASAGLLDRETLRAIVETVPDELLAGPEYAGDLAPAAQRARYLDYLTARLRPPRAFVGAAVEERERLHRLRPLPLSARR
jgi:hypothetical protein